MRHSTATIALVLCIGLTVTPALHAQFTSEECESIAANAKANPTNRDSLALVKYCPEDFGQVFATLLGNASLAISDTATYFNVIGAANDRVDVEVFFEANALAANTGASDIMRLGGLIVQFNYLRGRRILNARELYGYSGAVEECKFTVIGPYLMRGPESELGIGADSMMHHVASAVLGSGASNALRHVAYCLFQATPKRTPFRDVPNPWFDPATHFSFVKQCGRKFLLRNSSNTWVSVQLRWGSTPFDFKFWSMPPRPADGPYSENTWTVPGTGTTAQVIQDPLDVSLMSETPDGTHCP